MKVKTENRVVAEIVCVGCKSALEVELGDVKVHVDSDGDAYFYCECVVCRSDNGLKLPAALEFAIRKNRKQ